MGITNKDLHDVDPFRTSILQYLIWGIGMNNKINEKKSGGFFLLFMATSEE